MSCPARIPAMVTIMLLPLVASPSRCQIVFFPYEESFDALTPPALSSGWFSSMNRSAGTNDFTTTTSSVRSSPNAVISTNATIGQELTTPALDFSELTPDSLIFFTRRSSSHLSPVLVEVSSDDGVSFPIRLTDTLWNPGTTEYVRIAVKLPDTLAGQSQVRIRWRIVAGQSGTTGTFRLDDIRVTARSEIDLAIESLSPFPTLPGPKDIVYMTTSVRNVGLVQFSGFSVSLFLDADNDSTAGMDEFLAMATSSAILVPADSADVELSAGQLESGSHRLIAVASTEGDQSPSNDTLAADIFIAHPPGTLVLNEIMFEPVSGQPEYIELYNTGTTAVNLDGWEITVAPENEFSLSDGPELLVPGAFFVIAADSSLFSAFSEILSEPNVKTKIAGKTLGLNNDGDQVMVTDAGGSIIDTVAYLSEWHHPNVPDPAGRSLEKISPLLPGNDGRNWSTCALSTGGTPGRHNSIFSTPAPDGARLSFSPNPFSPDGDGYQDFTLIAYQIPVNLSTVTVRIYDVRGRLIRQLATNEPSGTSGELVWDGFDDERQKARIGMYVVYLEANDLRGATITSAKGVVVLAARLE